jgi:hypothetical protein
MTITTYVHHGANKEKLARWTPNASKDVHGVNCVGTQIKHGKECNTIMLGDVVNWIISTNSRWKRQLGCPKLQCMRSIKMGVLEWMIVVCMDAMSLYNITYQLRCTYTRMGIVNSNWQLTTINKAIVKAKLRELPIVFTKKNPYCPSVLALGPYV